MTATRLTAFGTLAGLALTAGGCDPKTALTSWWQSPPSTTPATASASESPSTDIGSPLYKPEALPLEPTVSGMRPDPIVVPQCHITVVQRQDVPSQNDGKLWFIGTEINPNDPPPPADQIIEHPETGVKYRILREGDTVKAGQLLGLLDDRKARARYNRAAAATKAAAEMKDATDKYAESSKTISNITERLFTDKRGSLLEKEQGRSGWLKALADLAEKVGGWERAVQEEKEAKVDLDLHEIRSQIPGVIRTIYRRPGESVKALEPVLQVHNLDRVRVEGLVDVQYFPRLSTGMKVVIEAARPEAPVRELLGHKQPITAVAVGRDIKKRQVLSASEDRTVIVWEEMTQSRVLPHPVAVRALAVTGDRAANNLALTGADDGKARLWDLDDAQAVTPIRELKGKHQGVIHCVALSPDGKTCATADEREIILWDVATGELKYRLPSAHRGPISFLEFTPQTTLVSAGRDNTLRFWKLGTRGAALEQVLDRRSGDVTKLDVSPDGGRVLFDQGKSLHVLTMPDHRTLGVLQNPSEATKFGGFAHFSPDGQTILTSSGTEGRMQLWRAPTTTMRAYELRQYATPDQSTSGLTDAAFSPDGMFLVTGTRDNRVLVWRVPRKEEIEHQLTGTVTYLEEALDSSARKVRIWAELANAEGALLPGAMVTLVAYPQQH